MLGSAAFRRQLGITCAALISLTAGFAPVLAAGPAWSIVPSPSAMAAHGDLAAVSCSSSTVCTAVGSYANKAGKVVPLAEGWTGASWSVQPVPNPSGAILTTLNGVSCPSATACFAAGQTSKILSKSATLVEAWNGATWSVQATPNPAGATYTVLSAISCSSLTSCMAVGSDVDSGGTTTTLDEAWNGTSWSILPTPNPAGATYSNLAGVSCTSSTACVAVGGWTPSGGNTATLAEAWNGTIWTIQSTPNPGTSTSAQQTAVSCSSSTMCTSVGSFSTNTGSTLTLAERWNGSTWAIQSTPNPGGALNSSFAAVACPAANYCTAVGTHDNSTGIVSPLAEGWNGIGWTIQSTPRPAGSTNATLAGVSCTSSASCVGVGQFLPKGANIPGSAATLVEGWDGVAWTIHATPNPVGASFSSLAGVSCTSSSACIAVGNAAIKGHGLQTLAEAWNGSAWTIQPTPLPTGALYSNLFAISCTSAAACTAVGATSTNTRTSGLAEQWNGTSWIIQSTPTPTGSTYDQLAAVSCASSTACEAVGTAGVSGGSSPFAAAWNGTSWSLQTTPLPAGASGAGLNGVSCTSSSACIAVGSYFDSTGTNTLTLVEAWNGTAWTVQASPNPAGSTASSLSAVSCPSPTVCTAVGYDSEAAGTTTVAEGWNGSTWTLQTTPNPSSGINSFLNGISCTSPTSCEAVGNSNGTTDALPLAEAWNGSSWSIQATPSPKGAFAQLVGVACVSAAPCYAVGLYTFAKTAELTLIESYS